MRPATERRAHHRVKAGFPVQLSMGGEVAPAQLRDISASGLLCETSRKVPVMTQVRLMLSLPGSAADTHDVVCDGAVVRCLEIEDAGNRYETAIFFTNMDEDTRDLLAALPG